MSKTPPDYLSKKNAHERDEHIVFDEGPHIYTIDGDSGFMSVTTWIHTHFSKFETEKVLENIFNGDVPLWVSSMKDIFIRKQPHGLNQLSRKKKNNGDMGYPKTIIAFTHKVTRAASTLESHSLNHAIAKIHTIFTNTEGLNGALHSWSMANQAGVITFFNNKEPSMQKILEKFDKDIKTVFKSKRIINTNTALDKYMLDWDIKQFILEDLDHIKLLQTFLGLLQVVLVAHLKWQ